MKAIVHIGTEKTGTTSIQSFLYQNRRKLDAAGFHFLQCAGKTNNRALPSYCLNNDRPDDYYRNLGITTVKERIAHKRKFIGKLEKELKGLSANTRAVIVSSEHFHSRIRTEEEMDNVQDLLSTYFSEIEIICYLRDQISTCTSYYSTALKTGNPRSLIEFFERCTPNNYYYNYWEMLQNWERCFGFDSLNVSLFAQKYFHNGNLLDDFTAKIDPRLVGALNKNVRTENESLNSSGQALSRAINLTFPVHSARPALQSLREKCQLQITARHTGKGRQLSPGLQREIFEAFATTNESLRLKYFPNEATILEPPAVSEKSYAIVATELLNGFRALLDDIGKYGRNVVHEDEYTGIYNILFSCINELLYEHGETKLVSTLSREEARFLRKLALQVETHNVPAAILLLQSLDIFDSTVPGRGSAAGAPC